MVDERAQVVAGARAARRLQHASRDAVLHEILVERRIVLEVHLRPAARRLVKRRLRDEEVPGLDDLGHLAIEERQQQRADVRAVDVRVRHDDDLVVAQLVELEIVAPDARAHRLDQRADLAAGEHPVEARALDVEDLAPQRQDRLEMAVAALLGRAAGAVALDQEQL